MAVMLGSFEYSLHESINFEQHIKKGLELDLTAKGGKKITFEDYLVTPNNLYRVEARDAQVPEFSEPPSLMDLSSPSVSPVLDTPAIIDSIVDVLPFRFNNHTVIDLTSPTSEMTPAAVNAILGIDETERFQDLTQLMVERPIPTVSCSPSPLTSPTDSFCSDITQSSSTSLLSAASTSSDTHFFALDCELIGSDSKKLEKLEFGSSNGSSYVDKRKRNNLASRLSRLTRREREKAMEKQLGTLYDDNVSLKNQVKNLEVLVEQTKKIIMQAVARR